MNAPFSPSITSNITSITNNIPSIASIASNTDRTHPTASASGGAERHHCQATRLPQQIKKGLKQVKNHAALSNLNSMTLQARGAVAAPVKSVAEKSRNGK